VLVASSIEQPCLSPSGSHSVDSQTTTAIISKREVVPLTILFLSSCLSICLSLSLSQKNDLFLSRPDVEGYSFFGLGFYPSASSATGDMRCVATRWLAGCECAWVYVAYKIRVWRSNETSSVLHLRLLLLFFGVALQLSCCRNPTLG
jgi:hypothetical protein